MLIEKYFLYEPILKPSSGLRTEFIKQSGLAQTPEFAASFLAHI
jgi:hypothetical protein